VSVYHSRRHNGPLISLERGPDGIICALRDAEGKLNISRSPNSAEPQYLYLLFDDAPSSLLANLVFTTEGHSLSLPHALQSPPSPIRRELHRGEQQFCPAYRPPRLNGLRVGIEQRQDWEYARSLIYGDTLDADVYKQEGQFWSSSGTCSIPVAPKFVSLSDVPIHFS
jgi:mannosidase alpha-like ER degradation enhancer 1